MGGVELDLRHARLTAAEVTIRAFCLMGGVSITVPEDMDVDVSGIGFMGGFDHKASGPGAPGAPRLRVVGFAMMGGVEVKRRPTRPGRACRAGRPGRNFPAPDGSGRRRRSHTGHPSPARPLTPKISQAGHAPR